MASIANEDFSSLAAFYMFSLLIGGFSPILAYGLSLLKGKKGISGWAWIFVCRTP